MPTHHELWLNAIRHVESLSAATRAVGIPMTEFEFWKTVNDKYKDLCELKSIFDPLAPNHPFVVSRSIPITSLETEIALQVLQRIRTQAQVDALKQLCGIST